MPRHIAIYGKGGVGKSSLASNLTAALAEIGQSVVLTGCDPKGDSTAMLHEDESRLSVTELLMSGQCPTLDLIVSKGFKGVACIEVGDPFLLADCASSGINSAFLLLRELDVCGELSPHIILYDLPSGPICSGFYSQAASSDARTSLIVTSADVMSLYAANTLLEMVTRQVGRNQQVALVANGLNSPLEEAMVEDFARQVNSTVLGYIPRSLVVKQCALYGKTVIEAAPLSNHSFNYRRLARQLLDDRMMPIPRPLATKDLKGWARRWGDRIYELEHGVVRDGGGI